MFCFPCHNVNDKSNNKTLSVEMLSYIILVLGSDQRYVPENVTFYRQSETQNKNWQNALFQIQLSGVETFFPINVERWLWCIYAYRMCIELRKTSI